MKDEKSFVLKLLEEGKINAEEADKLLNSLNNNEGDYKQDEKDNGYKRNGKYSEDDFGNAFKKFERGIEPVLRDFEQIVEPNLKKFGNKTVDLVENFVSNVSNGTIFDRSYSFKEFELDANEIDNSEIYLKSFADRITVSGYSGSKIIIKVYYKSHNYDLKNISLKNLDDKILLDYEDKNFESVRIDAKIPRNFFDKIVLASNGYGRKQGKLVISNIITRNLEIKTAFTDSQIINLKATNLSISAVDSDIKLSNTGIDSLLVDVSNCKLAISLSEIRRKDITSIASAIKCNIHGFIEYNEYDWLFDLKLTKFDLQVADINSVGFDVYAEGVNGKLNVNLPAMEKRKSTLFSKTIFYDGISKSFAYYPKKLFLDIHSENTNITIS